MDKHLELIAKSYDKGIDLGRKGINMYENLPEHITTHPDYHLYVEDSKQNQMSSSGGKEIIDYLSPTSDMNFVDLGCCLNLMFNGYDEWPSTYHGVDISEKTIQLLKEFSSKNNLAIGELFCGSIHETPFEDNYFDIAACIGILEYFERDFIKRTIVEVHRIIKPGGRLVLDIPNFNSPIFHIAELIEAHLGREDKFDLSKQEFETILKDYFTIEKSENVGGMIQYYCFKTIEPVTSKMRRLVK